MRAELKSDIQSPRSDVASDLMDFETKQAGKHKHFRGQITGLHRAAIECRTSVIGHGNLIEEFKGAVRRVVSALRN